MSMIRALLLTAAIFALCVMARGAMSLASESDDKKSVSELDRQYQEAVKNHDAATMGRILADDFILITGKGKVENQRNGCLRTPRRQQSGRARVERHARRDCTALGKRHAEWQAVRIQAMVQ